MYEFLEEDLPEDLLDIAVAYVEKMINDEIPPTFNFLLKYLHLLLVQKELVIEYDLVILDEAQDTVAVTLEIFKLISSPRKVMLGDSYQNIYGFMNTVNGFKLLPDTIECKLTKSFRCSDDIAKQVEMFGKQFLGGSEFSYTGLSDHLEQKTTAYITRTNGGVIRRLHMLQTAGVTYSLTRSISEIFAMPLALLTASQGKTVYHKKYKYLEKEYKNFRKTGYSSFFTYLHDNVEDEHLHSAIGLLHSFRRKNINIFDVLKKAKESRPSKNCIVTTAHAFKGLEADIVHIEPDMNAVIAEMFKELEINIFMLSISPEHMLKVLETCKETNPEMEQELNLYYVAVSRARVTLHNARWCSLLMPSDYTTILPTDGRQAPLIEAALDRAIDSEHEELTGYPLPILCKDDIVGN